MSDLTITNIVLAFIEMLEITNMRQLRALTIPRFTRSGRYLYRVVKRLETRGQVRVEIRGREKVIKAKGYRRRQIDHDLGVNDVRIAIMRSCWRLGYPVEQYFLSLNGWRPDGVLAFHKGDWRLAGIEYQKSPLTQRRWRNKINRISGALERHQGRVYVFFVVEVGMYYSERFVASLAQMGAHEDMFFTTKALVDGTPLGNLLTAPIFYHAFEDGKIPIFYEEV